MLEFSTNESFSIKVDGKEYDVLFPSVGAQVKYAKDIKKAGDEGAMDCAIELLDELGLPTQVSLSLKVEQLTTVINELMGSEKK